MKFRLVLIGMVWGLCWFFWLKPRVEWADPSWSDQFTQKAFWKETQQQIRRYGWTHDDFDVVGKYGDKMWAEWIVAKAQAGEQIADCGEVGHKDAALSYLTGQGPADKTNWNTTAFWLGWWESNKQKSQIEWIRDGLKAYGVHVEVPPSDKDYGPLLALLGNSSTNEAERIPNFAKYNAFRWLRDSGFNSTSFALSNVSDQTPELVRQGVIKCHQYEKTWPREDEIGLLEFGPTALEEADAGVSYNPMRRIRVAAFVMMLFPTLAGCCLLLVSTWRREQPESNSTLPPAA
jgi:hypothetical protein